MFSALMNAQNIISSIPITAVTWSIGSNTNSTYTGSAQSVTVVSVSPVGAAYNTSTTTATNAGQVASTTITGIAPYTGTFTSPTLTIIAATISGTAVNASATYNAASQSGTVITNVLPAGASYSGTLTASGTNAGTYGSSISGTLPNYTGTVNGGTFTISKATCTLTGSATIIGCSSFQTYSVTGCGGLLSGGIGTLTVYLVDKVTGATSVAASKSSSEVDGVIGANPITGLSNGTNYANVCFPSGTYYYGFSFGGDSNYNASGVGALNGDSCQT